MSLPSRFRDRLAQWRDRLVADPRFRLLAARFPLTRPVARRQARRLFDLVAGFVYSQVLEACVRLRLFELLERGPRTPAEIAADAGLPLPAALRLLDAAVSLDLLSRRGAGRIGLGPLGAAMLNNPGISAMVEHHRMLYADLADPVAILRNGPGGTRLARYWAYASGHENAATDPAQVADYTALMSASQSLIAQEVLDAYPFRRHRRLLDVGGGDGTFVRAVAERVPGLAIDLFDLPAVAGHAGARLAAAGLAARVTVHGGDFTADALPRGADLVTLVRVVHDHDDPVVARLLAAVRACRGGHRVERHQHRHGAPAVVRAACRRSPAWAIRWSPATSRSAASARRRARAPIVGERVFVPGARCFGPVRGLFGGAAARVVVPGQKAVPIDAELGEKACCWRSPPRRTTRSRRAARLPISSSATACSAACSRASRSRSAASRRSCGSATRARRDGALPVTGDRDPTRTTGATTARSTTSAATRHPRHADRTPRAGRRDRARRLLRRAAVVRVSAGLHARGAAARRRRMAPGDLVACRRCSRAARCRSVA
jgi:demethylspheroidene O-methyltransferase